MKWLGKWLAKLAQEENNTHLHQHKESMLVAGSRAGHYNDIDSSEGLNITVRNAMGGKIVTFRHYDSKADRHACQLYVIPDEQDFEKELCKLITLESMRL